MDKETLKKLKEENITEYWSYLFSPISNFSQDSYKIEYPSIKAMFNIDYK